MWIFVTVFAATCQSMRTAYQNSLAKEHGFLHATMARSLFGLPIVSLYLAICIMLFGSVDANDLRYFLVVSSLCALSQIAATYFMLRVFQTGSYAMGTLLAKTEAVIIAVLGIFLLANHLSAMAWMGVGLGVSGALVMSIKAANLRYLHKDPSLIFGLASGLCFAIASVTAAMGSHALAGSVITRAGVTLWVVLALQSLLLCSVQMLQTKDWLAPLRHGRALSVKVGILSAFGSIGWFTGFALMNPALVKTLGQIEIIGTLYFSKVRFGEKLTRQQWCGGAMIIISVLLVTLAPI